MINFDNMDGIEFERFIADLLRKHGFVVEETAATGDGGIDLIAFSRKPLYMGKDIIQCKKWNSNVGVKEVRDLYGVH